MSTEFELQELNQLLQDMQGIDDVFAEASLEEFEAFDVNAGETGVFSVLSDEFSAGLSAAGLGDLATSGVQTSDFEMLVGDEVEAQFIVRALLRNRVKKAIAKLVAYLKRNPKCGKCVQQVQDAISAYGKGQYAKALSRTVKAIICIRKCVRK